MLNVAIAYYHPFIAQTLAALLNELKHVAVVGQFELEKTMAAIRRQPYDIILCDFFTPSFNGLGLIRQLLAFSQPLKVIGISHSEHIGLVNWLLRRGLHGYLSYHCNQHELQIAIQQCGAGKTYIMQALAERLVFQKNVTQRNLFNDFNEKELQVLLMMAYGQRNRDIAKLLNVTDKTVSTYHQRVLEKLHMPSEVMLTHWAYQQGLLVNL